MPKQTLYDLLGVEQQAPAAEIKSQYRRLAKRYHPDLNPGNPQAEQQFREVQAAYEVLSDSEKRRQYDAQIGAEPVEFATGRRWQNGPRPYRRYDARSRQRPRPTRPYSKPNKPRAAYNHYTVEVSLTELFKGARRTLTIGQTFTCGRCRGRGRLEEGQICDRCDGYGFLVNYRVIDVLIPPGLHPGMNIRLSVDNDQPEHPLLDAPIATNISVTIYLRESKPFEYYNDQLHITVKVPGVLLHEGGEWTIPAPEGGEMTFKIPAGLTSGTTLTLRRRGLRNGASQRRGNLLCTVVAQP